MSGKPTRHGRHGVRVTITAGRNVNGFAPITTREDVQKPACLASIQNTANVLKQNATVSKDKTY